MSRRRSSTPCVPWRLTRRAGFVFVQPDGSERLWSFQAMGAEAQRRAAGLAALGLRRGDRVALAIPDGEAFVLSLLGTQFAGMVPVPLYPQVTFQSLDVYHQNVAHVARAAGASVLLTTAAARPYVEGVREQVEGLRAIVTVEELAQAAGGRSLRADVAPEDLGLIQFTSGSTSRPKGVMVTHGNLAANAEALHDPRAAPRPGDRQGRELAAALPRHGPHRLRRGPALHERPVRPASDGELRARARASGWTRSTSTAARSRTRRTSPTRSSPSGCSDKDVSGSRPLVPAHLGLRRRADPGARAARLRRDARAGAASIRARSCRRTAWPRRRSRSPSRRSGSAFAPTPSTRRRSPKAARTRPRPTRRRRRRR